MSFLTSGRPPKSSPELCRVAGPSARIYLLNSAVSHSPPPTVTYFLDFVAPRNQSPAKVFFPGLTRFAHPVARRNPCPAQQPPPPLVFIFRMRSFSVSRSPTATNTDSARPAATTGSETMNRHTCMANPPPQTMVTHTCTGSGGPQTMVNHMYTGAGQPPSMVKVWSKNPRNLPRTQSMVQVLSKNPRNLSEPQSMVQVWSGDSPGFVRTPKYGPSMVQVWAWDSIGFVRTPKYGQSMVQVWAGKVPPRAGNPNNGPSFAAPHSRKQTMGNCFPSPLTGPTRCTVW